MTSALEAFRAAPAKPEHGLPRDHLSASSLGTFARCPEQFRRRYMLGEKERPAAALLWGGADGATFEHNFRQKIESHEDLPEDDLEQLFAATLDERVERDGGAKEVNWGREYSGCKPSLAFADVKDRGIRLVGAYRRTVAPKVQPVAVERKIVHEIPGVPVPLIGYVDIEQDTGLIEAKTSGGSVNVVKNDWRMQGRIYQAATRKPIEWHVKVKTKTPAVLAGSEHPGLRLTYSERATRATEARIRGLVGTLLYYLQTFGPDEPWPTNAPDSWGNVCGYCGFRPTCGWWAE